MRHLELRSVRFQRVVNPRAEHRGFHGSLPGLSLLSCPLLQYCTLRRQSALAENLSARCLAAEIDVFLVYVESDIVSRVHWVLLYVASEPALDRRSRHSSPSENPSYFSHLCIQTDGTVHVYASQDGLM